MKNFALVYLLFFAISMSAQNEEAPAQNNWMISINSPLFFNENTLGLDGGIGFYSIRLDDEDTSINQISLGGTGYYRFNDQFYGGLLFGVQRYWIGGDDAEFNGSQITIGPSIRYYHFINKGAIFGQGYLYYGRQRHDYSNLIIKEDLWTVGLSLGYAYPVSEKVDIEGLLSYDIQNQSANEDTFEDDFRILNLRIGLSIKL